MLDLSLDHKVFIKNELAAAVQELDILLNTENTELIGYPSFGTDFEQFLWQLTPSPNTVKSYIEEKILTTYFLRKLQTDISVDTLKGEYRMIYNINIIISDDSGNTASRKYQFR